VFLVGDVIGACFRAFLAKVAWPWASTHEPFFNSVFWKLRHHPRFRALDCLSSISGAKIMAQKTKIG